LIQFIVFILNSVIWLAVHLGMEKVIPFMERDDWMENGKPKFKVFCPVTQAERKKRLSANERRSVAGGAEENKEE
jgi:hypothetical protein